MLKLEMKLGFVSLLVALPVVGFVLAAETGSPKPSTFCQGVMNAIGETPEQTILKFGTPLSREDKDMKSTHSEGVVDKVSILQYSAARIGFLFSGDTGRYILLGAELAAGSFDPALKALIPPSREATLSRLGAPEEEQDKPNVLRYFCTPDLNEWVDLVFEANSGLIKSLEFRSHID